MERFEVGGLDGHREGSGQPALMLHGGPGMSDYMGPLAGELDGVFESICYTQRGTPPSTSGPPYTIESHVSDAIALLDHFDMGQAWAFGHSWGGHLALHLAVAHPDRIAGLVCLNALGAYGDGLQEFSQNLRARIPAEDAARVDTLTGRERLGLLWPGYFADPASAPAMPGWELSTECAEETWASIEEHFERGTLAGALPLLEVPTLLIHGVEDPFPAYVSQRTAALMPNARLEELPARGHFPWLEQPGQVRSLVEGFVG